MPRVVNCTLHANHEAVKVGTPISAWLKSDDVVPFLFDGHVEEEGRLIFHLPDTTPTGGGTIYVELTGYEPAQDRVTLPPENATEGPAFDLVPLALVKPVKVQNRQFVTEDGEWLWKGSTDFLLFKRYLEGRDIEPVVAQRREAGANLVRVLGMAHFIEQFYPKDYGTRYYKELPDFANFLATFGLYLEFTVFADAQVIMPTVKDQQEHFAKVCGAIRG